MHRKFGKKDVIFIGALLGICLIVLGVWYFAGGKQGALVVVTRDVRECRNGYCDGKCA